MSDQKVDKQFWTIERAVAFVVAPIATPLSGALALWLSKHFPGVHVTGGAIYAFAATAAGGTAAGFIKWLDGRQKFVASLGSLESHVSGLAQPLAAVIPEPERKALLAEFEGLLTGHLLALDRAVVEKLKLGRNATAAFSVSAAPAPPPTPEPEVKRDPAEWNAPNDPAPPTPPAAAPSPHGGTSPPVPGSQQGAAIQGS